jgi:S1-C subfamily serine protease
MRKPSLYSSATRPPAGPANAPQALLPTASFATAEPAIRAPSGLWRRQLQAPRAQWWAIALLSLLLALSVGLAWQQGQRKLTQADIDAAVLKTLETTALPSAAAAAYENIAPSVVRVMAYSKQVKEGAKAVAGKPGKKTAKASPPAKPGAPDEDEDEEDTRNGVGTGVVIVDKGLILTNLHVVAGADRIVVVFSSGMTSTASITNVQPENDLAVLQAHTIPDDLVAATMRSTADLAPGDQVLAVGYPFGIGPSASAGIVSGLGRVFRSPEGGQSMRNLIQFDAAANPGNSGGPLVTMDGEVVGIVTAILNPTPARTFIGIGFAVPIENAAQAAGMPPF